MDSQPLIVLISLLATCLAGSVGLLVTGRVRDYFSQRGFVDRPNEARKQHKLAVAYGGGSAILIASCVAIALVALVSQGWTGDALGELDPWPLSGLAMAAVLMWAVGLYDDIYNMRGTIKLFWQVVAACLVVAPGSGLIIDQIIVFGIPIRLGYVGIPLAMIWVLAAINSLNLLDGMDALAASVGLLFSLTIGIMAICTGRWLEAIVAFSMGGSLIGFLRYNWPPASIYLGDSGSMLIGLVLGTLAIRCEVKDAASIAVAAPLAMFAIPLIDSGAALVRRKFTGRSMYATDRGHIHHRLLTQGLTNKQAVLVIAGLCLITCIGAVLDIYLREVRFPFGMVSVIIVGLILLSQRIFGVSELSLLGNRMGGLIRRVFPASTPRGASVRLQGNLEWDHIWQGVLDSTQKFDLIHVRLNLQLPDLHEDFYASWRARSHARSERRWNLEMPLTHDSKVIGKLSVVGAKEGQTVAPSLIDFSELVAELERQLGDVIDEARGARREALGMTTGE